MVIRKNSAVKTISLKVPQATDRELTRRAASRGVSKSDLVREAVAEYLVEGADPAPGSFLAAAADLVGCVEAAENLSCEPAHLAGFGR
jgi:predicted DNA-binding protein